MSTLMSSSLLVREVNSSTRSGTGIIPQTIQQQQIRSSSSAASSSSSSKHVQWSTSNDISNGTNLMDQTLGVSRDYKDHHLHLDDHDHDPDLDRDVKLYSMEKSSTRSTRRYKDLDSETFDYNMMASIPPTASRSPILSRKQPARSPSPTIDPRSVSPDHHHLAVPVPPKVAMLRTPSPKDKIEHDDHNCKYHSHHLDYVYTPPPVKGPCIACGLYIIGSLVTALDGMWHPECFTCVNCDGILKGHEYVIEDGKQYCKDCHLKLFGPPCSVCHKPTGENRMIIMNRIWHPQCFACVQCGKKLKPDNYVERLGSPYCKECYHQSFSPKCCVCQLPITDKAINALNKMWHPHCFKCVACGIPLSTSNFYEKNGLPYCENDFHKLFSPKCAGCKLPITDNQNKIIAMGKQWHPKCFICVECAKPLNDNNFIEHDHKPYCEFDYHRLFSPKCAGCDTPIVDPNKKLQAMGKPWHPHCFTCAACAKQLTPPHFVEKNGKPYCLEDYHRLFSPKCAGCNLPITDPNKQVIAQGKPWHPQCFACTQCAKPLSPNNFLEKNGKPYCEDDYHKLFSPKCAGCHLPITDGNRIMAMGKPWHPQCFQCTQCAKPLSPDNFFEKNGKPYCEADFHKLFSPKCAGCKLPITDDNYINALGKKWHPNCFTCTTCVKPLDPYNFFEKNGLPYCEADYHKLFSPKCGGCDQPITDPNNKVSAMGKPWHPNCFTCAACAKVLTPPNFKEKNGKAYCLEDYHRLFSPKCAGCETPIADPNKQVEAMGKKWHPPCFACTVCAKPLSPYDYKENKGKPYCEDDYNKLFMPKCAACTRPITGPKVSAMGKDWHPQCFQCDYCHKVLSPNNYMEKGGKPYCVEDYHRLFSQKCAGCAKPITDNNQTIALGKSWHPKCFKCATCSVQLTTDNFMEKDGVPYCKPHYYQLFAPKCYACRQPILDKVTTALGQKWHPDCFKCVQCHHPLMKDGFREKDAKAYCLTCYHGLFSPKCAACDAPIEDQCLTALGKTWHPEHFTCQHCNKLMSDDPEGYHEVNDKAYCRDCYFDLFASKCRGCHKAISDKICVTALGSQWHPDCFVCRDCHCPLKNGNYFEFEGEPYCEEHYRCKNCPDCVKLRRAQNKYFGKSTGDAGSDINPQMIINAVQGNTMVKLGA